MTEHVAPPEEAREPDPLVTALEAALDTTVAWRKPAYLSDTVQTMVAAGEYKAAATVLAKRLRSFGIVHEDEARAAVQERVEGLRAEIRRLGEWTPDQWDEVRGGDPIARTINAVEDILDRLMAEGRAREAHDGSRLARSSAALSTTPDEGRTDV